MDSSNTSRREFTSRAAWLLLGGAAITISGCGKSSNPAGANNPPASGTADKTGSVSANHGHTAVITGAQLDAGNALTLNIAGSSGHPHTVQLSASEVVGIRSGTRVSKVSSVDDGHDHTVTFN